MREVTSHKVNGCNENIGISVVDEPGSGGANHVYQIDLFSGPGVVPGPTAPAWTLISFQNGPIKEVGTNGITHEALLAIIVDRLKAFGLISEIVSWQLKLYVPAGAAGADVFARLVDRFPIQRIADRKAA